MGLTKRELEKMEEAKMAKEVKECVRCHTSISSDVYDENNGLCDYCMDKWAKTEKE